MKSLLRIILCSLFISVFFSSCQKENEPFILNNPNAPVANAGPTQTLSSPVSSVTLTGTGNSQNGPIRGYLWSLVSGPNLPQIMTPSSPTTLVNSLIAGTYIFQFAIIDSAGLTGVDTVSVKVISTSNPIQTLTLQPANNPVEWLFFGNASINESGASTQLDAGTWTSGGAIVFQRGAFKFNFSAIPGSATILSARLSLYSTPNPSGGNLTTANAGSNNSFYIRSISANWIPTGSTWLTQPPTTSAGQVLVPHTDLPSLDLIDIDVTNLVSVMHTAANNGFMIMLQNEAPFNNRQFASSRHTNTSKHPRLIINYQ